MSMKTSTVKETTHGLARTNSTSTKVSKGKNPTASPQNVISLKKSKSGCTKVTIVASMRFPLRSGMLVKSMVLTNPLAMTVLPGANAPRTFVRPPHPAMISDPTSKAHKVRLIKPNPRPDSTADSGPLVFDLDDQFPNGDDAGNERDFDVVLAFLDFGCLCNKSTCSCIWRWREPARRIGSCGYPVLSQRLFENKTKF